MISGLEVRVSSGKPCKRCGGRGIGTWGMTYGECYRCGGGGFEMVPDVKATMAGLVTLLARIQAEGEAAKASLAEGGDVLKVGNARRALEFARRQYKEVREEQRRIAAHYKMEV